MIRQLECETSTEATQSETWNETQPTRHRRESEATTPTSAVPNATQGIYLHLNFFLNKLQKYKTILNYGSS